MRRRSCKGGPVVQAAAAAAAGAAAAEVVDECCRALALLYLAPTTHRELPSGGRGLQAARAAQQRVSRRSPARLQAGKATPTTAGDQRHCDYVNRGTAGKVRVPPPPAGRCSCAPSLPHAGGLRFCHAAHASTVVDPLAQPKFSSKLYSAARTYRQCVSAAHRVWIRSSARMCAAAASSQPRRSMSSTAPAW